VRRAHDAAKKLHAEGRHVVVVGRRDHIEVLGLVGSLPRGETTVLLDERDENGLNGLEGRVRIGVVAQTTQPLARVSALVEEIRRRFPSADVKFVDTVCYPTKTRQDAVLRLARELKAVVVIGGKNSNNVRELADAAAAQGARTWWVESDADLDPAWFRGLTRIGVTAGTSTPDESIARIVHALETMDVPA
jgi:4-hydroxy-3-methylbut-2-enyl diphosphate reductase